MRKLLILTNIILAHNAIYASDQDDITPLLLPNDKVKAPYSFYYGRDCRHYNLVKIKTGCCTKNQYIIDNLPVTKTEYNAVYLNQKYQKIKQLLTLINQNKVTTTPGCKLVLLVTQRSIKDELYAKIFAEFDPSCCVIS